jgi:hypothetical protein
MNTELTIPDPAALKQQIAACRAELAALKKLLRLAEAAQKVDAARRLRQSGRSMRAEGIQ